MKTRNLTWRRSQAWRLSILNRSAFTGYRVRLDFFLIIEPVWSRFNLCVWASGTRLLSRQTTV
jgi:hypothetical protein